jgi:hypothetical protein
MMLKQRAIGTFSSYELTETALLELKAQGFSMDRVSIVGHDLSQHVEATGVKTSEHIADLDTLHTQGNESGEGAKDGAIAGGSLGSLTGLLVGLGAVAIPGIGPVMLAGAAATAIATVISGGVIGAAAGSLVGGLVGLGIPADRAKVYTEGVARGDYLVIVEGSEAEIATAHSIFAKHSIHDWYAYYLSHESMQSATPVSTHSL